MNQRNLGIRQNRVVQVPPWRNSKLVENNPFTIILEPV